MTLHLVVKFVQTYGRNKTTGDPVNSLREIKCLQNKAKNKTFHYPLNSACYVKPTIENDCH